MIPLQITIAILLVTTSCGAPHGNYSVTILNDSSLGNFLGAVHTWLAIRSPWNTTLFSFTSADFKRGLVNKVSLGRSSVDDKLKKRKPNEEFTFDITERQHTQLIQAIEDFYKTRPKYSLLPQDDSTYNCVTAANKILSAANIHFLKGYEDPFMLGLRLATVRSVLEKCLASPNIFMFLLSFKLFSSFYFLLFCLLLWYCKKSR